MNLFYQPGISDGVLYLDPIESKHCVKVLRKKPGDRIQVTDGKGVLYTATITHADPSRCQFTVEEFAREKSRNYRIHIAIAPTKQADRIEWFIEKSVELGIDVITLIECDHSERTHLKLDRLYKIAVGAMKQSLQTTLPTIIGPVPFVSMMADPSTRKFIAHVDPENQKHLFDHTIRGSSCLILIGPEGDFSKKELTIAIENNFQKVSLGNSRLRTETAGMAACHILNLVNT